MISRATERMWFAERGRSYALLDKINSDEINISLQLPLTSLHSRIFLHPEGQSGKPPRLCPRNLATVSSPFSTAHGRILPASNRHITIMVCDRNGLLIAWGWNVVHLPEWQRSGCRRCRWESYRLSRTVGRCFWMPSAPIKSQIRNFLWRCAWRLRSHCGWTQ